jgi:glycosyl transferase family 2/glycosyl transferase family 21
VAVPALRRLTAAGAALAVAGTAHTAYNLTRLRVPPADPPPVAEPVALLLPVRDEAHRVGPCLRSLLAQTGVRDLRILVLDDGSTDGTADVVRRVAGDDPRVTVLTGAPLPAGWWGKPWACQQLADAALATAAVAPAAAHPAPGAPSRACAIHRGGDPSESRMPAGVLVFVDADVVLAPHAVAATVTLLRWAGLDLVSPYPRQLAETPAERLVQPLLQWSWLTTLPLRVAERSPRESLAAANGQLLAVDAGTYRRAGGHAAVRAEMLEDIALLRAVKRAGGRGGVVDGTEVATCRMYEGWPALRDGYAKSLWSAFGSPAGALAAVGALGLVYVLPPVAALRGSRVGLAGYAAGVAGRALVGRRVGARVLPDVLAHPASVAAFGWLTALSLWRRRRGTLTVRGRPLP